MKESMIINEDYIVDSEEEFYKEAYEDTIKYLSGVYPLSDFRKLNFRELANFYNSLTFYYNCSFRSPFNLDGPLWESLSCEEKYPLPYVPSGYFYDFTSWNTNDVPTIYYDKSMTLHDRGSCRPNIAWTNTSKKQRTGPGTMWTLCRTLQRDVWYPNGIRKNDDKWVYVVNQPFESNIGVEFLKGVPDNGFIEVTHIDLEPGMATSPGFWWACYIGTGLFVNVGKTLIVRNKLDGVFKLVDEVSKKFPSKLNIEDPYLYIWNLYFNCGYTTVCNDIITPCKNNETCYINNAGVFKYVNTMKKSIKDTVIDFFNSKNIKINDINNIEKEYIKMVIDASINCTDYILNRWSDSLLPDESLFYLGLILDYDTIQITFDANANGYFSYELLDLRVPEKYVDKLKNRDYSDIIDTNINNPYSNTYKDEFVKDMIKFIVDKNIVTTRDPLKLDNYSKCDEADKLINSCYIRENGVIKKSPQHNFFCSNVPLSNEYKCLGIGIDYKDTVLF